MSKISRVKMTGALMALVSVLLAGPNVQAQLVWTGSISSASWDTLSPNWSNGTANALYADGSNVVFNDSAIQTMVNIKVPVSPGSVMITNNAKTFSFTNNIITGVGGIIKDGPGKAYFGGTGGFTNGYNANSFTFAGGASVIRGELAYFVSNTDDTYKAQGGVAYGFGSEAITLASTNAIFRFSGLKNSVQITNNLEVTGGGMLSLARDSGSYNPQNNYSGNIAIRSPNLFTINGTFSAYGNAGDKITRVFGGATKLYTNGTFKLINTTYNARALTYEQNIIAMDPSYWLKIAAQGSEPIEISGNNTGVVAGITLVNDAIAQAAPVLFMNTNAMSAVVNVSSGCYAGLPLSIDAGTLAKLSFENGAALGVESNTAVTLDLSATGINRDIWIGSVRGAILAGTLTPFGSSYKFGGGGSVDMNALVLTNENKLTGSRDLQLGDPVSLLQPGVLVLTASNSFTGGVTINPSRGSGLNFNASPILISRAAGALGSGPISINRGSSVGLPPVLQFEVPYLVLTNSITITNALSSVAINTFGPLTLRGNLTVYGTNSLNIMASNSLSPLTIFDQVSAGNAVSFVGQNGILNVENGLFDPVSAVNIPMNIGFRVNSGMLVLSPGFSWSNLVAGGRTWMNTSSPTSGQWKVCNFAARGATQVIDGTGAFETGKTNTWLLDGSGSAPMLGSLVTNADGTFYANAGIKITRDITLALPYPLNVKIASTGPGLTNASVAGIVHELAGTLSGPGSLYLTGSGTANAGLIPELVLSGSSLWTNGVTLGYQGAMKIMTGPGGMGMAGNAISGFVRFKGNASLPSGNGGAPAYIFAGCVYQNAGLYGFLLTGSTSNQVYSLTNGMRFVLGGLASSGVGPYYGTFGSAYENTTLTNSMISVWNSSSATNNQYLNLLVRDTNGIFTLGSSAGSVKFSSSYCVGTNGINNWAMTNGIEPMLDRVAISTLIKRGPGVLVLSNVTYELFAGGGNISTNFSWQLGSGTMNLDDGVVRETGTSTNDSMRTQYIVFNGAVMGLSADYPVARIGTNNTQINMAGAAGGGFAAYGASRTVTLIPSGSTNTLGWGTTSATAPDFFMTATAPMILNAKDADASVVLESAQTNAIKLVTANNNYTIKVMDNPLTTTDQAVMAIRLTSVTNLVGASLTKNGPGTLVLTATNNDYQAATFVSNGTLIVNGNLHSNRVATASNVTVCSGATLSGTGTIARTVMVLAGGTLTAGAGSDQPGTLTVSNLMLSATGTLVVDVSASGVDKVVVGGGAVALTGALLVVPAAGYDMTGGDNLTIMTAASFSGEFTSVPRGYTVRIEGTNLILHRDSPGFIFRIQ